MPPAVTLVSESSESENVTTQETFAERMLRLQGWTEGNDQACASIFTVGFQGVVQLWDVV